MATGGEPPDSDADRRGRDAAVRFALKSIPDAVLVIELPSRRRVYANDAVVAFAGVTREEFEASPVGLALPPGERERFRASVRRVAAGGPPEVLQSEVLHRDGRRLPVEVRIDFRPDGSGEPGHGYAILIGREVSERHDAQQRLRRSEESFRIAFDEAAIGKAVVEVDPDGARRIVRANRALGEILGADAADLIGRDFGEFTLPDEPFDPRTVLGLPAGIAAPPRPKRYRRLDGTTVWVDFRASLVDLPEAGVRTVLVDVVDITVQRLAEERRRRRAAMTSALAHISTEVLAGRSEQEIYRLVVDGAAEVFEAENVSLGFPEGAGGIEQVAWHGPATSAIMDGALPRAPMFLETLRHHQRVAFAVPPATMPPEIVDRIGPFAAARFATGAADDEIGFVALTRARGAAPFDEADLDLLEEFASHLGLAVELGRARAVEARVALLEERQRIARDLHDSVIQDVISVGLQLVSGLDGELDAVRRSARDGVIEQLNRTVRQLRGTVFDLRPLDAGQTVSTLLATIVADAGRALGFRPALTLTGPLDALPDRLAGHAVAVVREALANVVRHAGATLAEVQVTLDGAWLSVVVEDDGCGMDRPGPGFGLSNIAFRARSAGGTVHVGPRAPSGTRVVWTVPIDPNSPIGLVPTTDPVSRW